LTLLGMQEASGDAVMEPLGLDNLPFNVFVHNEPILLLAAMQP